MKLVRESLNEFHQTGDPLKSLNLGASVLYNEILKNIDDSFVLFTCEMPDEVIRKPESLEIILKFNVITYTSDSYKDWSLYDVFEPFKTLFTVNINTSEETIHSYIYNYNADIPEMNDEYTIEDNIPFETIGIKTAEEIITHVDNKVWNIDIAIRQFTDDCWDYVKKERNVIPEWMKDDD